MPMRYRRVTARFVYGPAAAARPAYGDPFWGATVIAVASRAWRPAMDVCETDAGLTVVVELAGLDEERTEVALYADALLVEGERSLRGCGPEGRYHRAEIRQGPFRIELPLPFPIDASGIDATYDGGLLRVVLPRAAGGQMNS
jgi:HSP20 family protein